MVAGCLTVAGHWSSPAVLALADCLPDALDVLMTIQHLTGLGIGGIAESVGTLALAKCMELGLGWVEGFVGRWSCFRPDGTDGLKAGLVFLLRLNYEIHAWVFRLLLKRRPSPFVLLPFCCTGNLW